MNGTRVELKENKKEGWKKEIGTVVEMGVQNLATSHEQIFFIVLVDWKYRDKDEEVDDDGLREITPDQIERTLRRAK
jgi:hypothetical protein